MSVISFENVTKRFGKFTAVNAATFTVSKGEIIGFVGPNGAGKTTAISMLLGFIKPSEGNVSVLSQTISPQSAHTLHKHIGYAAGDMALFDNLTGQQYLDFLMNQYGNATNRDTLVKAFNPKLGTQLKRLSRGNKQKIAIIGALQHQPDIIILDEPTSGLDPLMQKIFLERIEFEKKRGATVFMSSHILSEVAEVSDRVLFMRDGKIIINQKMSEIKGKEGKVVTITGGKHIEAAGLPKGSHSLRHLNNSTIFDFSGDPTALSKWLGKQTFTDFSVQNQTLDDLFEHLYETEAQR